MSSADPITLSAFVNGDTICRRCGYNLRGLDVESRCPECSTPVKLSCRHDWLYLAEPRVVSQLARGASLGAWGVVAMIIGGAIGLAMLVVMDWFEVNLTIHAIAIVCVAPRAAGSWLLTSGEKGKLARQPYRKERGIARMAILVASLAVLYLFATARFLTEDRFTQSNDAALLIGLAAWLVGELSQLRYLMKLARRLPGLELVDPARQLFMSSCVLVTLFTLLIAAAMIWSNVAGLYCMALPLLIASLIFAIMYVGLLRNFAEQLQTQNQISRRVGNPPASV